MLNINEVLVRLGGRTILDRASAAIPPGARVGLIGRNGAGTGSPDPDRSRFRRADAGPAAR